MVVLEKTASLDQELRETLEKMIRPSASLLNVSPSKPPKITGTGGLKILVVDDSQDIHKLMDLSFRKLPEVKILHCLNPLEAEGVAQSENPDLILLDVQMPEISGEELFGSTGI